VCLVAMNSIILLWVISVYLKSCDINYIRYLTRTCRLFADEHSLSFFWEKKNVKCRCIEKKKSKCFVKKKNLSVRRKKRKIFKVWRGGKMFKYRISGVRKKKKSSESKIFGNFAKFVLTGWKVEVKLLFENKKMIAGVGFEPNHVWAPCWLKSSITWANWKIGKENVEVENFLQ
jgi:hypothetical protein